MPILSILLCLVLRERAYVQNLLNFYTDTESQHSLQEASQQHRQVSVSVHLWTINWMFMNRKATCCTGNKSPIKRPKNNNRCTICYLKLEADCCFFNIWFVFKHMSTAMHLKHTQNKVCILSSVAFCTHSSQQGICLYLQHTKIPLLSHTVLQLRSPSQFAFLFYLLFYWSV